MRRPRIGLRKTNSMKTQISIGILILIIVFGIFFFLINGSNSQDSLEIYTVSQISDGNTIDNCLVIYSNEVFKIPSSFINVHEGGSEEILRYCGRDLTSAFDNNPNHGSTAKVELLKYKVGKLQ